MTADLFASVIAFFDTIDLGRHIRLLYLMKRTAIFGKCYNEQVNRGLEVWLDRRRPRG
ncbi:hypothetical protein XYCOK13_28610 [Xylanibacillus composti]|uniref:Uncharacterized protein n=1 Tax=Xylanibacillus composti TaxID=1572762 RepID=A0A8J4H302_9BACL|nr:hypothetical protein XYCOK13_28610 [Xylanibacillus composti]